MADVWLQCSRCGFESELGPIFTGCLRCLDQGRVSPLEVAYSGFDECAPEALDTSLINAGLWRWRSRLPPIGAQNELTLGEGDTALSRIPLDGVCLYLKNETQNPTWSWKDRSGCLSVAVARAFGFDRLAAVSTGNLGNSVAAYSAAANASCTILCHPESPALQVAQMSNYGANVIRGGEQGAMLRRLVVESGYFPCSPLWPAHGVSNPFGVEGLKTIAFEIYEQLGNRIPDRVFVPVGSGDGIYGIWKGFRELRHFGIASQTPHMVACQASGADSLYRAFQKRRNHVEPLASVSTAALSVGELAAGDHALRAVYESGGTVLTSSDADTFAAMHALMRHGFAVEPSSAVAFSCARAATAQHSAGEAWIVVGSGAAVKWPECLLDGFTMPEAVAG